MEQSTNLESEMWKFLFKVSKARLRGSRVCHPRYAFWDIDYFKLVIFFINKTQNFCPCSSKPKYCFIFGAYEVYFLVVLLCSVFFSVPFGQNSTCLPSPQKINRKSELLGPRGWLRYSPTLHKSPPRPWDSALTQCWDDLFVVLWRWGKR